MPALARRIVPRWIGNRDADAELDWKEAVVDHHRHVPTRLLECDPSPSATRRPRTCLVEGDNLEALKALLPRYRGQVKCIYIDPPYNTGNEGWVYNDNVNDPADPQMAGRRRRQRGRRPLPPRQVALHDVPAAGLLREFLSEDGVIFVSIDDNEDPVTVLIDEVLVQRTYCER